jgi:hypothetical protein
LKRLIEANLPGDGFAPVIFPVFDLAKRHVRTSELTLERWLADWKEVNRTLAAIARGTTWAPTPSPLWGWCNDREQTREEGGFALR